MPLRLAGEAVEGVGDRDPLPQVEAVAKLAFDVIHGSIAGDIERVRRLNPDDLHHLGGHRLGTLAISQERTRPQNPQPLRGGGGGGLERDGVGVGVGW